MMLSDKGICGGQSQEENCQEAKGEEGRQIDTCRCRPGASEKAREDKQAHGDEGQEDRKESSDRQESPKEIAKEIAEKIVKEVHEEGNVG